MCVAFARRLTSVALLALAAPLPLRAAAEAPPIGHVFVIVLENESYQMGFGPHSPARYLARELPRRGALLSHYYGIGHYSLDNYIAMINGQAPNADTQDDCPVFADFVASGPAGAFGQLPGRGCVYPASVPTLADQLDASGLGWRAYMEDMGNDPQRESAVCGHPPLGAPDPTEHATRRDQYAAKHDPFVYAHAIIDDAPRCASHVVNLDLLQQDLARLRATPRYVFITPNLCHDGHDSPCANGEQGGLVSVDRFLRTWVPRITASPAFRQDGLLVITFDEGLSGDSCCAEQGLPGGPLPGRFGPGGDRVGAVLLSRYIRPGTKSARPYNHYSLLRSVEDYFGLAHLGYAASAEVHAFGADVFTRDRPPAKRAARGP